MLKGASVMGNAYTITDPTFLRSRSGWKMTASMLSLDVGTLPQSKSERVQSRWTEVGYSQQRSENGWPKRITLRGN